MTEPYDREAGRRMRDPSDYAGKTVRLRADAPELGGHTAEVVDWWEIAKLKLVAAAVDFKAQDYGIRAALAGLPVDDDLLYARVDGMMRIIHVTEIEGYAPPISELKPAALEARDIGATCPACERPIRGGDMVAILVLGPGTDPAERAKALAGEPYNAAVIEVHWACRTGDERYERKG